MCRQGRRGVDDDVLVSGTPVGIQGLRFGVQGARFRVWGSRFRVRGTSLTGDLCRLGRGGGVDDVEVSGTFRALGVGFGLCREGRVVGGGSRVDVRHSGGVRVAVKAREVEHVRRPCRAARAGPVPHPPPLLWCALPISRCALRFGALRFEG